MRTFRDVENAILEAVRDGTYPPGARVGSIRELALAHQTSKVTVSRALKGLEEGGRLERGPGRGYFVPQDGTCGASREETIGLLLGCRDGDRPMKALPLELRAILSVVQELMMAQKRSVLAMGGLVDSGGKPVELPIDAVRPRRLRGLLVAMIYRVKYLVELSAVQQSVAVLDMDASDLGLDSVAFDNVGSAAMMVRLLVSDGARRIAFVGGPFPSSAKMETVDEYDPCARERLDGWRVGHLTAGVEIDPSLIRLTGDRDAGTFRQAISEMLAEGVRPDAIMTEIPAAAAAALADAGLQPDQIAIAGWTTAATAAERVKTVRYTALCDFERMGKLGVEMLTRRLEQPERPVERSLIFPTIVDAKGKVVVSG